MIIESLIVWYFLVVPQFRPVTPVYQVGPFNTVSECNQIRVEMKQINGYIKATNCWKVEK